MSYWEEYQKQWAIENQDKVNAASRRYRKRHPKRHLAASNKWREANRDRVNTRARERHQEDPEKRRIKDPREFHLKTRYGLTRETWQAKFDAQGCSCAVCKRTDPGSKIGWCVDHCHKTDRVRDILCHKCNLLLGQLEDDVSRLHGLIAYLEKHRCAA